MSNHKISAANEHVHKIYRSKVIRSESAKNQEKTETETLMTIFPGLTCEQAVNPWIGFGI
jgi:hypothetical protein